MPPAHGSAKRCSWRGGGSTPRRSGCCKKERDQADGARAFELQRESFEPTRVHQERVAVATEHDAEARRITDLNTKAVEQLGSEKALVRLGGLYALERLAQDNPRAAADHRQRAVRLSPYALCDTRSH